MKIKKEDIKTFFSQSTDDDTRLLLHHYPIIKILIFLLTYTF